MARSRNLGYGEGSVYYEKETGRWRGELRLADGRRRRISAATRSEATEKIDRVRAQVGDGQPLGDDTRLDAWVKWWLQHIGAAKSPRTADHARWALDQITGITSKRLRDLTVADVETELQRLATREPPKRNGRGGNRRSLGRSSLSNVRRVLAEVLTEAERRDMIARNVAKLARIPVGAKPPTARRSLTHDEAERLIRAAEDDRYQALVIVMLYCGLRPGEVTGLAWTAVDLQKGTITIHQSRKVLPDGTMIIGPTKARSDRILAIPTVVANALRGHKIRQAEERLAASVWEDSDLVFANEAGRALEPSNLRRLVVRLCKMAQIEPISPNELRHSAASLLVANGVALEEVADLLGHRDVRMLAQVYRHRVKRIVDLTEAQGRMLKGG